MQELSAKALRSMKITFDVSPRQAELLHEIIDVYLGADSPARDIAVQDAADCGWNGAPYTDDELDGLRAVLIHALADARRFGGVGV